LRNYERLLAYYCTIKVVQIKLDSLKPLSVLIPNECSF
jgi:hypothetical protein